MRNSSEESWSVLLGLMFLLMYPFVWCKRGTMGIGKPDVSHISILGPMLTPIKRCSLQPRTGKYGFCTDYSITFLSSCLPFAFIIIHGSGGPALVPMY